mmetsp:Transcript_56154/g.132307  ORF Transcript_56154/g.132307 Transcript_56154/m.132307 type:complete len:373 (+) Transcript_56154:184-1302(+)
MPRLPDRVPELDVVGERGVCPRGFPHAVRVGLNHTPLPRRAVSADRPALSARSGPRAVSGELSEGKKGLASLLDRAHPLRSCEVERPRAQPELLDREALRARVEPRLGLRHRRRELPAARRKRRPLERSSAEIQLPERGVGCVPAPDVQRALVLEHRVADAPAQASRVLQQQLCRTCVNVHREQAAAAPGAVAAVDVQRGSVHAHRCTSRHMDSVGRARAAFGVRLDLLPLPRVRPHVQHPDVAENEAHATHPAEKVKAAGIVMAVRSLTSRLWAVIHCDFLPLPTLPILVKTDALLKSSALAVLTPATEVVLHCKSCEKVTQTRAVYVLYHGQKPTRAKGLWVSLVVKQGQRELLFNLVASVKPRICKARF